MVRNVAVLVLGVTVGGGATFDEAGKPTLSSGRPAASAASPKASVTSDGPWEYLFRGDMIPDLALGCTNPSGTSGGPNEWATKVTASLTPPFIIYHTTYNVGTFSSGPTWDMVAWQNGASPGAELGRVSPGPGSGTPGDHSLSINPAIFVFRQTFFFGLSQGSDINGMRLGMDTSGSTPGTVFIHAPGCGIQPFLTVESLGFPGYWVDRVTAAYMPPVELMSLDVN